MELFANSYTRIFLKKKQRNTISTLIDLFSQNGKEIDNLRNIQLFFGTKMSIVNSPAGYLLINFNTSTTSQA